jgi:hypothetical protein
MVASSRRFVEKWPAERISRLTDLLHRQGEHRLVAELRILVENNMRHLDPAAVEASEYVKAMHEALGA